LRAAEGGEGPPPYLSITGKRSQKRFLSLPRHRGGGEGGVLSGGGNPFLFLGREGRVFFFLSRPGKRKQRRARLLFPGKKEGSILHFQLYLHRERGKRISPPSEEKGNSNVLLSLSARKSAPEKGKGKVGFPPSYGGEGGGSSPPTWGRKRNRVLFPQLRRRGSRGGFPLSLLLFGKGRGSKTSRVHCLLSPPFL